MNILRFINSKDIREHLKTINYEFNSLEAAWLIYQCKSATIEEKHTAWKELIRTMHDCEVPKRMNTEYQYSLHKYLKDYIDKENILLNRFFKNAKNCIFEYGFWGERGLWFKSDKCYYNFEECLTDAIKKTREFSAKKFEIRKRKINTRYSTEVKFINEKVYSYAIADEEDDEYELLYDIFHGLYFEFPTPFEKGDILCEYEFGDESDGFCRGPFVICRLPAEQILTDNLDMSDMNVSGYFLDDSGSFYLETMYNYMNLEFYHGHLKGKKKLLELLSMYTKNHLDISLFASAYHHILCEENLKEGLSNMHYNELVSHLINGEDEQKI